jgi:hypothetical protein
MQPGSAIFIPSKGRATRCLTPRRFEAAGFTGYRIVIEPQDLEAYAAVYSVENNLLELPENDRGIAYSRQFIKNYSSRRGDAFHWQLDDDLSFKRRAAGRNQPANPCELLAEVEMFVTHYANIGLAGLQNDRYAWSQRRPLLLNRQCSSCFLVNNAAESRFRQDVIEDTDFSMQILTSGYCTLLFNQLLFCNPPPAARKGGNTTDLHYGQITLLQRNLQRYWPRCFEVGTGDDGQTRVKPSRIWGKFPQRPIPFREAASV